VLTPPIVKDPDNWVNCAGTFSSSYLRCEHCDPHAVDCSDFIATAHGGWTYCDSTPSFPTTGILYWCPGHAVSVHQPGQPPGVSCEIMATRVDVRDSINFWAQCGWMDPSTIPEVPQFTSDCCCADCNSNVNFANTCLTICPGCAGGYVFDVASGLCWQSGADQEGHCPSGTWWDSVCRKCVANNPPQCARWDSSTCSWTEAGVCYCGGHCVSCTDPTCKTELNCTWNLASCVWECDAPGSSCTPEQFWNWLTCTCDNCPAGYCYCETSGQCVPCTPPPCATELHCVWDKIECAYQCDPPTCPIGYTWSMCDCACYPDCPAGQKWCATSGACVGVTEPDCADERGCCYRSASCDWYCAITDVDALCGPAKTWNWETCRCEGDTGPWIRITQLGKLYVAEATPDGIKFRRSEFNVPPFEFDELVVSDPSATSPRFVCDLDHRIDLTYNSGGDVKWIFSDDEGETWSDAVLLFIDADYGDVALRDITGEKFFSARISNQYMGRWQDSGDDMPQPAVLMLDAAGDPLAFDPAPHHVEFMTDEEGLVLVAMKDGDAVYWRSYDNGETWEDVS
jgi:hypothetical protein